MAGSGTITVIANREGQDVPAFLARLVSEWRDHGINVVGVLAEGSGDASCSAGFLRNITSGKAYSIQLDAPPSGTVCHLDAAGMDDACAGLLGQIASADVVILSKFGKLEAVRQGLWPAFSAAVAAGKPLLTTVSRKHEDAFRAFAPEAAWVDADHASLDRWWRMAKPLEYAAASE